MCREMSWDSKRVSSTFERRGIDTKKAPLLCAMDITGGAPGFSFFGMLQAFSHSYSCRHCGKVNTVNILVSNVRYHLIYFQAIDFTTATVVKA